MRGWAAVWQLGGVALTDNLYSLTREEAAGLFEKAAERVASGWCQGVSFWVRTRAQAAETGMPEALFCVNGALGVVLSLWPDGTPWVAGDVAVEAEAKLTELRMILVRYLAQTGAVTPLANHDIRSNEVITAIAAWNDAEERTQAEVVSALTDIARLIRLEVTDASSAS